MCCSHGLGESLSRLGIGSLRVRNFIPPKMRHSRILVPVLWGQTPSRWFIFNSSAIILKDSRRSSASIRRTRSMLSGVVLVGGRPERGSSLTSSFPL
ncbi:hypothetical protein AVEN_193560-1 [Araneus ventricosus]|uniref:Uncharacterized protein n=1 Tax=Araneus ventricosus TaxID=182803 RepID=A0A4Y2IXB8_ARAVE|nr:hypothetical protein AVEN_193560-1 [Araneus ventricosus]